MAQFPPMPLFVDAYMADTMHLTEVEDGVVHALAYVHVADGNQFPKAPLDLHHTLAIDTGPHIPLYK